MDRLLKVVIFVFAALLISPMGCGYRFNLSGTSLRGNLETLAIVPVKSSTTLPGVEADFTDIIRQEFLSHSTIPIVSREHASALLIGKIERVETAALTYDIQKSGVRGKTVSYETTNLRRIKVKLSMKMINKGSGEILWQGKDMEEKASYTVSNDPLENQFRERVALRQIAEQLAKRIYLKTVDTF